MQTRTLAAAGALFAGLAMSPAEAQTQAGTPATDAATPAAEATTRTATPAAKPEPAPKPLSPFASVPTVPNPKPGEGPALFTTIAAGGETITLGETTLAAIAAAFGGAVSEGGTEGARAHWLCYAGASAAGPAVFWFISDAATGGPDQTLTGVAVEPQGSGGAGTCEAAPEALTAIDAGLPGPGTRLADLRAALGTATPGPVGHVHYAAIVPATAGERPTRQTAVYTGAGGRVTGLALASAPTD